MRPQRSGNEHKAPMVFGRVRRTLRRLRLERGGPAASILVRR